MLASRTPDLLQYAEKVVRGLLLADQQKWDTGSECGDHGFPNTNYLQYKTEEQ